VRIVCPSGLKTADLTAPPRPFRAAVESAFRAHYSEIGKALAQQMQSREPRPRQLGQALADLEYENLMAALELAMAAQENTPNFYVRLSDYLDRMQDNRRGLVLGEKVL
jgi:hypothetical protein